jgi:hypothetical protein
MNKIIAVALLLAVSSVASAKVSFDASVVDLGRNDGGDGVLKVRKTNGNYVLVKHAQQNESNLWNNQAITVSQVLLTAIYNGKEQYADRSWTFVCSNNIAEAQWNGFDGTYTMYTDCIFDY